MGLSKESIIECLRESYGESVSSPNSLTIEPTHIWIGLGQSHPNMKKILFLKEQIWQRVEKI